MHAGSSGLCGRLPTEPRGPALMNVFRDKLIEGGTFGMAEAGVCIGVTSPTCRSMEGEDKKTGSRGCWAPSDVNES